MAGSGYRQGATHQPGAAVRILLVHPGASWSTFDVWQGLDGALKRAGCDVIEYALDGRIERSMQYLHLAWTNHPNKDLVPRPTHEDVLYMASEGIVTRALRFEVDWVLVIACGWLHPHIFYMTRRAHIPVAVLFTESPNEDDYQLDVAKLVDVCWTNERSSVPAFGQVCAAHYWRHAIDPAKHHVGNGNGAAPDGGVLAHDVVFVGTGWDERVRLLSAIDWDGLGIDLGLYGSWELLENEVSPLHKWIRRGITPNDVTAELYRRAKISLNLHRTSRTYGKGADSIEYAESMNPRCYELAATGCFFVSDKRAELCEVFGDAVPTFDGPADLQAQILYWLAHDDERRARAALLPEFVAGQTFDARAQEILTVLEGYGHV